MTGDGRARATTDSAELLDLLEEARDADPTRRINFRDPIAEHGQLAIQGVRPWLSDPRLAAFAVRVIERASKQGPSAERLAIEALSAVRGARFSQSAKADASEALRRLGAEGRSPISKEAGPRLPPEALSELVQGRIYRRRDLRDAGLLGNLYSGISYPADGVHACLFSGGANSESYGYRDMPAGEGHYRYFGEWRGNRDMSLTGGNKAIVDRSPNLYLFVGRGEGFHRFEGRFMVVDHERVVAEREGAVGEAIVFLLERVADRVEI